MNASLKLPGRGKSISIEEIKQLLERYRAALRKTGSSLDGRTSRQPFHTRCMNATTFFICKATAAYTKGWPLPCGQPEKKQGLSWHWRREQRTGTKEKQTNSANGWPKRLAANCVYSAAGRCRSAARKQRHGTAVFCSPNRAASAPKGQIMEYIAI